MITKIFFSYTHSPSSPGRRCFFVKTAAHKALTPRDGGIRSWLQNATILGPPMLVLLAAGVAQADCTITSGGGSPSTPNDGSVITCDSNNVTRDQIGDGTTEAKVNIESNTTLDTTNDTSNSNSAINLKGTEVDLGQDAEIINNVNVFNDFGVYAASNNAKVTLDTGAKITSERQAVVAAEDVTATLKDNATVESDVASAISGSSTTVTLNGKSSIVSTLASGVVAGDKLSLTINDNAYVKADGSAVFVTDGNVDIKVGDSVGDSAQIIGDKEDDNSDFHGITANGGTVEVYGDVFAGSSGTSSDHSIVFDGNEDDTLILHTGSNIASPNGADLGPDDSNGDTLTLKGNNTEDEKFLNVETVNVDANSTGWELNSTSEFDTINVNSGEFRSGSSGNLTVTDQVIVKNGATLAGSGTVDGDITIKDGGTLDGTLSIGGGGHTVTVNGGSSQITGDLTGGSGNDSFIADPGSSNTLTFSNTIDLAGGTGDTTTVNSGTVLNNGTLKAETTTVNSGATFGGTGTTTGMVVNNGTVAPGNSVGTQTINGDYTQNSDGELVIEFDSSGTDLLDVSGTADIDGTLTLSEAGTGVPQNTAHTFIDADGGITGNFSDTPTTITTNDGLLTTQIDIKSNKAQVTFVEGTGLGQNADNDAAQATVDALNSASDSNASAVSTITNALRNSDNTGDALSSQSGQVRSTAVTSANTVQNQAAGVALDRAMGRSTGADVPNPASGVSTGNAQLASGRMWLQGLGGFGDLETDSTAPGTRYDYGGGVAGLEFDIGPDTIAGGFAAFTHSDSEVARVGDKGEADNYQIGIYGGRDYGDWRASGELSGAYIDFETSRPTGTGTARADFDGWSVQASGEALYDLKTGYDITLSPLIGAEMAITGTESYRETGAGVLNMRFEDDVTSKYRSLLGVETGRSIAYQGYSIQPRLRGAWAHNFGDDHTDADTSFVSAGNAAFTGNSPDRNRDSLRLGAELSVEALESAKYTKSFVSYDGDVTSDASEHSFRAGFKFEW